MSVGFTACTNQQEWTEKDTAKLLVPVGVVGGYFGSVAVHEGGHALTAKVIGGDSIKVTILPTKDDGGHFHLGLTEFRYKQVPSSLEDCFFNISGTLANLATHIATRELLKTGEVPIPAQPIVSWFSLMNQGAIYGQLIFGFARLKSSDFGKEPIWVSCAVLGGTLLYDIVDIIFDNPDRYFGSLFGTKFYTSNDRPRVRPVCHSERGGGFLGLGFDW